MPHGSLVRPGDVVVQEHEVQSARKRASQGHVRVISYNFFLRPDLLTV